MSARVNSIITATVGALSLTSADTDPPDDTATQLADGLTITRALGDKPWPMPPVESATFNLFSPTVDDLLAVQRGTPVLLDYWTPRTGQDTGTAVARFEGLATDVVLRPHPLGVLAEVTALDVRSTRWAETDIGDEPWPEETILERLGRIADLAGFLLVMPDLFGNPPGWSALCRARDVDAQPMLAIIDGLMDGWALEGGIFVGGQLIDADPFRFKLAPIMNPATGEVTHGALVPMDATLTPDEDDLPGTFGVSGDGYGVVVDAASRNQTLVSADYVDLSASYTQRRGARPNRVQIKWTNSANGKEKTTTASTGEQPPSIYRLETELVEADAAQRAAELYLPDPAGHSWYAETFVWYWHRDTFAHDKPLPDIGDLVTIAPLQERHDPVRRGWYVGTLVGLVFRVADAKPIVELTISPLQRPMSDTGDGLTWNDVAAGVTWDQLNTSHTWDDYRLLRGL